MEFTKITNSLEGDNQTMMVVLWDLGPSKPEAPKRPVAPKGNAGDPEFDLALIEFKQEIEDYEAALKAYRQAKIDFAKFQERYGGPYEITQWSVDAADTLARDPNRYCISSRTRGYERAKNGGLPAGLKPGHGHAENLRRQQEGYADLEEARRRDPVFGTQEVRP